MLKTLLYIFVLKPCVTCYIILMLKCNHHVDKVLFNSHIITADRLCAAYGNQAGRSEIRVVSK